MRKISWGVLSTAKIGLEKVIPAMQKGRYSEINAIASRNIKKARKAAEKLKIPSTYGSYEELMEDNGIDAVYIPLPNHLHIEWAIRALHAGKHVLCEKPIGLNANDAARLLKTARNLPQLNVMEAFMYRFHPRWQKVKMWLENERIGKLINIHSVFTYYNVDPENIRNKPEIGGGGLLDIGCYCISLSRFIFNDEPRRVCATMQYDPIFKTDRLVSAVLEFNEGTATFTCSTQSPYHQYAKILGNHGRIDIENPFTPNPQKTSKITLHSDSGVEEIVLEPYDQYTLQGDMFSKVILEGLKSPLPLHDAVANMTVIDRIKQSAEIGSGLNV
jgi:predicted dehydrogenase